MTPFFVFGLPRSRTAWISRWLSYGTRVVGHDIAVECDTTDDFLDHLTLGLDGTVETGAVEAWPLILEAFPKARVAVVFRPMEEVLDSLHRAGFSVTPEVEETLNARLEAMVQLARRPGVMSVAFASLKREEVCADLHEHLTGEKYDRGWWSVMAPANVQFDPQKQIARLTERAPQLVRLKEQVGAALERQKAGKWLRVGLESFETAWPDAESLCRDHFEEVNRQEMPWRKFDPDLGRFMHLNRVGVMQVVTARRAGVLQGYMTWFLTPDFEAMTLRAARQGAWFAREGTGIGVAMARRSISLMKRMGMDYMELHHRLNGRGSDLSWLFRRLGAIPVQHNYNLHLGG